MKGKPTIKSLRKVHIDVAGKRVVAWEPKDPNLRSLGRWTDPQALLNRMYELEHPSAPAAGPNRQWQQTWRGRVVPASKTKARRAA
jgi:hypothetical protein